MGSAGERRVKSHTIQGCWVRGGGGIHGLPPSTIPCVCIEPMMIHNARYLNRAILLYLHWIRRCKGHIVDCQYLFGAIFWVFIFLVIFDRELLTPLEVHYYTKDIFIGLITEAQRRALQEDPCPGFNWGPSLGQAAPLNTYLCRGLLLIYSV
jgi:hypothetical protein